MEHRQSNELRHRVPRNPIARLRIDERTVTDLAVDFIPDAVLPHDEFDRGLWLRFSLLTMGECGLLRDN